MGHAGTTVERRYCFIKLFDTDFAVGWRRVADATRAVMIRTDSFGRSENHRLNATMVLLPSFFCLLLSCFEGDMFLFNGFEAWRC